MNQDELIKIIDDKIAQLEQEERAEYLLRKALFKKGVISSIDEISDEKAEELLSLLSKLISNNQ